MEDNPVFPPELFAIIIGTLAHDLETLRSCALVSSTFYDLARVFSHIQVGPLVDKEHNFGQLCALLEGSPPFAARVESFRICIKWKEPNPRNWILEADLGRCLSLLTSLTRLCIAIDGGYLPWPKLSRANRHSIQAILPTLTCLELKSVAGLPLALFSHCLSLRSLTLDNVVFADSLGAAADTDSYSIQLRYIVFRVGATNLVRFVDWVTDPECPFDTSCLRSLECSGYGPRSYYPVIQRLLNASLSVRRLCIKNYFFTDELHKLDLRQLVHLRTLALDIYLDSSEAYSHQRLLSLRNFLFPPSQQAPIALLLDVRTQKERIDIMQNLADADYILCRLPFETVTVILYPKGGRKEKLIDVYDEFVSAMPLLASKPDRLRILEAIPVQ
ncbi:hypothetical protein MSAN_01727000 [Mycena sanguinolenta]|uniref:Uncharacterized protein n=1 Tax=Mycena sanguinolenta TaxID=230812 RepID=A0A8H6XZZ8_9AGAR|nr:hypothetical protein MSAN_01727000 [Mycena sanguinolenta]